MCLDIILTFIRQDVIENLNGVLGVLVVDDGLLHVETWNLTGDSVFLDEPLLVRSGVLRTGIYLLIVLLKRTDKLPSHRLFHQHLLSSLLDVFGLMSVIILALARTCGRVGDTAIIIVVVFFVVLTLLGKMILILIDKVAVARSRLVFALFIGGGLLDAESASCTNRRLPTADLACWLATGISQIQKIEMLFLLLFLWLLHFEFLRFVTLDFQSGNLICLTVFAACLG